MSIVDIDKKSDVAQILATVSSNSLLGGNKPSYGGWIFGPALSPYSATAQQDTNNITDNAVDAINNSDYNNSVE